MQTRKQALIETAVSTLVAFAPLCNNCEGHTDTSKPAGGWGFMNHTHRQKDPP